METSAIQKINYTLKETPWYFGAYLNQARHNLFLVLNDLTIRLGFKKPIDNDNQLLSCKAMTVLKEEKINPILLEKAMAYYDKNLPFLFSMHYKFSNEEEKNIRKEDRIEGGKADFTKNEIADPRKYFEILEILIANLNRARNHFSQCDCAQSILI